MNYKEYLCNDVLNFWLENAIDSKNGGIFTCLDKKGNIYGTDKSVWFQGRALWVFSKAYNVIEKNDLLQPQERKSQGVRCVDAEEAMKGILLKGSAVWNRLFKRDIFQEIRFPLDRINDDEVVALHAYAECKKIVFLDADTYYYRIRSNSITTSKFSLKKLDWYYNSIDNLEFVKKYYPSLIPCGEYKLIYSLLYCYTKLKGVKKTAEVKAALMQLKNDIRKNKTMALKNTYLSVPLKVLTVLAAI